MLKRKIKYTDLNGEEQEDIEYFHLDGPELVEMQVSTEGGMGAFLQRMIDEKNNMELVDQFKKIILMSYGVKSTDGRSFEKSDELRKKFEQRLAFKQLYLELMMDEGEAAKFIDGILPADFINKMKDQDKPDSPPQIGDSRPANN